MTEAIDTPFASFAVRVLVAGIKTDPVSVRIVNRVWVYVATFANWAVVVTIATVFAVTIYTNAVIAVLVLKAGLRTKPLCRADSTGAILIRPARAQATPTYT